MDGDFWGHRVGLFSRRYGGGIMYLGFALGGLGMAYRSVLHVAKKYALEIELREQSLWIKRLIGVEEFPWATLKKAYGTDNSFVLQEHNGTEHNVEVTFEDFDTFRKEVQRRIAQGSQSIGSGIGGTLGR